MDKTPQLMFALQSPVGLKFGATVSLDSERITFEMDVELTKGITCNFRMELVGVEETVMGAIRVDRVLPKRQGSLQRYIARIVEMPDEDRKAFDGWRRDQATGGISRRLDRDPEAIKQRIVDSMRGATEAEARMVLDKMNQKSIYKRKSADIVEGDPFGLTQEGDKRPTQDSSSMRASLREQASKVPESTNTPPLEPVVDDTRPSDDPVDVHVPAPMPTSSSNTSEPNWMRPINKAGTSATQPTEWLDDTGGPDLNLGAHEDFDTEPDSAATDPASLLTTQPSSAAATTGATSTVPTPTGFSIAASESPPTPAATPESTPSYPPTITVDASQTPIEINVRFESQQSLVELYKSGLQASSITIPDPSLTQLYTPVKVNFTFHDQQTMSTFGQTVSQTNNGMAVALEFNTRQRLFLGQLTQL